MAIAAGDFRTGLTLIVDGDPWVVLDFQHVKPGKGAAILKTKMKNLKTGSTQDRNFNASTKFEAANIEKKTAQYSYEADSTYYFMDMETYDTYELSGTITGTMILPDDITLEDYEDYFTSEIEEKIEETRINYQKTIDITEDLWQNILVEIPLKAVNEKNKDLRLEGDGWRLISEDDVKTSNNPLSSLKELL